MLQSDITYNHNYRASKLASSHWKEYLEELFDKIYIARLRAQFYGHSLISYMWQVFLERIHRKPIAPNYEQKKS